MTASIRSGRVPLPQPLTTSRVTRSSPESPRGAFTGRDFHSRGTGRDRTTGSRGRLGSLSRGAGAGDPGLPQLPEGPNRPQPVSGSCQRTHHICQFLDLQSLLPGAREATETGHLRPHTSSMLESPGLKRETPARAGSVAAAAPDWTEFRASAL